MVRLDELRGRVAAITGGGGVLCSTLAVELARCGVRTALLDLDEARMGETLNGVRAAGSEGLAVQTDVLDPESLAKAADAALSTFGRIDYLINGAGGNHSQATTSGDLAFVDLPREAVGKVFDLNFLGTFLASQAFLRPIAKSGEGAIVNISSMNAFRPLTHVVAYSAAKAAVSNFTAWLAVHVAREISPRIRVNAIAPGFFLTKQNQFLLQGEDGALTERGRQIIEHTPVGRFGSPEELTSTLLWLLSPASSFVTGAVIPVDGGFAAYAGV